MRHYDAGRIANEAHPGLHLEPLDAPPSGECLCRIAPATIMVNEFVETTLNANETQLLPSNYGTFDR